MSEPMILHRVIVTMTLTEDPDPDMAELVNVEFEGEPTLVTALGMLRMAEDSLLHGPDEGDSDD